MTSKLFRVISRLIVNLVGIAVLAGVPGLAASAPAPAPALLSSAALPAPVVLPTTGTLPNGVGYTLLPHARDSNRISLRLVVLAGSLDERDDERGFAHFVEHMAFNGSRHYPAGKLVDFFQSLGLGFGNDLWAGTSLTQTIYRIDLPAGRGARLGDALEVFRDFADGLTFEADKVQREKGVLQSELTARNNNDAFVDRQRLAMLYRGTAVPDRLPGGESADIERATAPALREFYQRCYQPARLRLIVTGDIEVSAVQALLERHFGSLLAPAKPTAQVLPGMLQREPVRAEVVTNPLGQATSIGLVVVVDSTGIDPHASFAESLTRGIVVNALSRRLVDRRAADLRHFGQARGTYGYGVDGHFAQYVIDASTADDMWETGVALLETELRRARETGFSKAEIAEQITTMLASFRAARDSFASYQPDAAANHLAAAIAAGRAWVHPAESCARAEADLPGLTEAGVLASLRTLFSDDKLNLMLIRREAPPGGREALLAAYRASAARPLPQADADTSGAIPFRYGSYGVPGRITGHVFEPDLATEMVLLANNVRLSVHSSGTEPHRFRLSARLGRGLADSPRDKPGLAHLASHFFDECDLGRHTLEEVRRLLEARAVYAYCSIDQGSLAIEIEGAVEELPFALNFLTARISDTRLDRSRLFSGLSAYAGCRENQLHDSASVARLEGFIQMADGDPRLHDASMEEASHYTMGELTEWMRLHWLEGPVQVSIAGDIDPSSVIASAAASLGTLPVRRTIPDAADEPLVLRAGPAQAILHPALPDKAAAVQLAWAAPGAANLRRRRALSFAVDVLVDRLLKTLRQDLGATYSPGGNVVRLIRQPGFAYAMAELTFEPDRAAEFMRRAIALGDTLARDGITEEEFTRLREPLIAGAGECLRSNAWWLAEILPYAPLQNSLFDEARSLATGYSELTREDVNRAAAEVFPAANASSVLVLPTAVESAKTAGTMSPVMALTRQAEVKLGSGNPDGALADLAEALALDPKNARIYTLRSRIKSSRGDHAGALEDSNQAITLDPKDADAYGERGALKIDRSDFTGALADCTQALTLDPTLAYAYVNRAIVRLLRGDPAGTIVDTTHAIALESKNAIAYAVRGEARLTRGDVDHALPDLNRAIELAPRYANAYRNRGIYHQTKKEWAEALADFDQALTFNTKDVNALVNRGIVKSERGDQAGAVADYDQALALSPDNAGIYNNRGYAHQRAGDLDAAIADFTRAIDLSPNFALPYANRGAARKAKHDLVGATEDGEKAAKLNATANIIRNSGPNVVFQNLVVTNTKHQLTRVQQGNLKLSSKDHAGAIIDFTQALEDDPTNAEAFYGRAVALHARNDIPAALVDLNHAIEANPKFDKAYMERGNLLRYRRDFNRALADYAEIIQHDPKSVLAHYYTGMCYEGLDQASKAFPEHDLAVTLNPGFYFAICARGNARQARRDYEGALRDFDETIRQAPKYALAYALRAFTRHTTGNLTGSLDDYNALLKLDPKYPTARLDRGHVRESLGDFPGALEDYEAAIIDGPTNVYPKLYRWTVQRRLGQPDATDKFKQLIAKWSSGWPKTVGLFFTGQLTEEKFLAEIPVVAKQTGRGENAVTCDATYYAGLMRLFSHDPARAREFFEQCIATERRNFYQYMLAKAELERMTAPERPAAKQ